MYYQKTSEETDMSDKNNSDSDAPLISLRRAEPDQRAAKEARDAAEAEQKGQTYETEILFYDAAQAWEREKKELAQEPEKQKPEKQEPVMNFKFVGEYCNEREIQERESNKRRIIRVRSRVFCEKDSGTESPKSSDPASSDDEKPLITKLAPPLITKLALPRPARTTDFNKNKGNGTKRKTGRMNIPGDDMSDVAVYSPYQSDEGDDLVHYTATKTALEAQEAKRKKQKIDSEVLDELVRVECKAKNIPKNSDRAFGVRGRHLGLLQAGRTAAKLCKELANVKPKTYATFRDKTHISNNKFEFDGMSTKDAIVLAGGNVDRAVELVQDEAKKARKGQLHKMLAPVYYTRGEKQALCTSEWKTKFHRFNPDQYFERKKEEEQEQQPDDDV